MTARPFQVARGFTFIELVVAIAILAILATIVLPRVMGKVDDASVAKAKSDVREVLLSPVKFSPQAAAFELNGHPEWTILDYTIRGDFDALAQKAPGFLQLLSRDRSGHPGPRGVRS